jgi:hypothetical protein
MLARERDTKKSLTNISVTIIKRLGARRSEIVQAIHTRIREHVPSLVASHNSSYQPCALAAILAVLDYCLAAIEHGLEWSGPVPPEAAAT